jgi:aryl-alcohol dehydrogenase-like predicted oxidoreductase
MNYRRLGRTGLQVSEISLGTVELGLDYGVPVAGEHLRPAAEEAARLLNRALDLGVNFIDTARSYGASEEVIGRALKSRRKEYLLATKLAPIREEGQSDRELREQVKASIVTSLQALQTDVIDLLQSHHTPVEVVAAGRVVEAMKEAQAAGYVRFIGASTYGEEAPLAVLEDGRFDTLQVAYSPVDRTLEERVLPLAQQKSIGVIVRSVLLRGVLTHRYKFIPDALADLRAAIERLSALVGDETSSLPEMAYRFVLDNPAVSTALVGTARLEELEAALGFAGKGVLSPELAARIRQINVSDRRQLVPSNWPADLGVWQGPPT